MLLYALLAAPVITALLCWFAPRTRWREAVNVAGTSVTLLLAAIVLREVASAGPLRDPWGILYADALSALMAATVAGVGFAAALFSVGYLRADLAAGHVPGGERGLRWYYLGFHIFIWTMLVTVTVASLGLLWVVASAPTQSSPRLATVTVTSIIQMKMWKPR